MEDVKDSFKEAVLGKKIPVITLDNRWHQLFTQHNCPSSIKTLEGEVNNLLKRQGKLTVETKEIRKIKSKLMDEIVQLRDKAIDGDAKNNQQLEEKKRLIAECNEKSELYQDELLELPKKLDVANRKLMVATMENCYDMLKTNSENIQEIDQWVVSVRVDLKKKLIAKQKMEVFNRELYNYMHDIFGAEIVDVFDMKNSSFIMKKNNKSEEMNVSI